DVGEVVDPTVLLRLTSARDSLARLAATYARGRLLSAGCRVAILGRPNAGQSTLFNALLGTARAIVTEVPGTTRDTIEATIDVAGIPVDLVDTAGLRDTDDRVEKIGVERAREEGKTAAAILYVFDASAGWLVEDGAALAALDGKPVAVVANKIDRLTERERQEGSGPGPVAGFLPAGSSRTALALCGLAAGAGASLRALLEETIAADVPGETDSELLASLRQLDLIERARDAVTDAHDALARGVSPEYAATHVDSGLAGLADAAGIQFKILNRSRGPAVWGPRAQCDKALYSRLAAQALFDTPNLRLVEGMAESFLEDGGRIAGVVTGDGTRLAARAVIVTTGTFLRGLMHTGQRRTEGGRVGEAASVGLSAALARTGLSLGRFKTGTPPRVERDTV